MSNEFNAAAAAVARDAAIEKGSIAADTLWRATAMGVIQRLARTRSVLTTDDVWRLAPCTTHDPRALGGVMRQAARLGLIVATDRTTLSERVACHRRPIRVWRSLIYRPGQAPLAP